MTNHTEALAAFITRYNPAFTYHAAERLVQAILASPVIAAIRAEERADTLDEAADYADRWNEGIGSAIRALKEQQP